MSNYSWEIFYHNIQDFWSDEWHECLYATIPSCWGNLYLYKWEVNFGSDGIHHLRRKGNIGQFFWDEWTTSSHRWMTLVVVMKLWPTRHHQTTRLWWMVFGHSWGTHMHHGRIGLTYLTYLDPHEQTFQKPESFLCVSSRKRVLPTRFLSCFGLWLCRFCNCVLENHT